MKDDPIVEEVRRARDQIAAKFNYDLRAIAEDAMRRQKKNAAKSFTAKMRPGGKKLKPKTSATGQKRTEKHV